MNIIGVTGASIDEPLWMLTSGNAGMDVDIVDCSRRRGRSKRLTCFSRKFCELDVFLSVSIPISFVNFCHTFLYYVCRKLKQLISFLSS